MYCNNCGNNLPNDSKFCNNCGQKISNNNKQGYYPSMKTKGQVKDAVQSANQNTNGISSEIKVLKCPCCGDTIDAFATSCKSCGAELRGLDSLASVKELERRIKDIEATRKPQGFFDTSINVTDINIANEIKNFPIPNTKEDIFEYLILAASNIDPTAYDFDYVSKHSVENRTKLMLSEAWISKYNQAYHKALLAFPNDPSLASIKDLYDNKQKEIKKNKFKQYRPIIIFLIFFAVLIFIIFML